MSKLKTVKLTAALETDFWKLHCDGCDHGWCCCTAWHDSSWEVFSRRSAGENRERRLTLFARGEHDGYLLYLEDRPVGWCQAGQRDRLALLLKTYDLTPDPTVHAITCFFIHPDFRGRGFARRLLGDVLIDLQEQGAEQVEVYPRPGHDQPAGEIWNGPVSLYIQAGFNEFRSHPEMPVYRKRLLS